MFEFSRKTSPVVDTIDLQSVATCFIYWRTHILNLKMKACGCLRFKNDIMAHNSNNNKKTKWTMFLLGYVVLSTFTIPTAIAFHAPMMRKTDPYRHFQAVPIQSSMDHSSNQVATVTTPPTNAEIPTTIQVCGSKDCTRRGGGARLERQIQEVCARNRNAIDYFQIYAEDILIVLFFHVDRL